MNKKEAGTLLMGRFMHTLPKAVFVSLPVFVLILLLYFDIGKLQVVTGWGVLTIIKTLLVLSFFFYLYQAVNRFYVQRRFKTILKFTVLNIFSFLVVSMLVLVFFLFSLAQFA
ncbi:MAG: hypothetical protein ABI813_13505 [Bacteroidota bacterium]